jgi:hypothetical protein
MADRSHSFAQPRGFHSDERANEVVSGLRLGETIAVSNTFLLKAEMPKGAGEE